MIVATRGLGQIPLTPAQTAAIVASTPAAAPPASNVPTYSGPECDNSTLTGTLNWYLGRCTPLMAATEAASQNLGPGASAESVQAVITSGVQTYSDYQASLPTYGTPSPADSCGLFQTWDTPSQTCVTSTLMIGLAVAAVAIFALAVVKR
jgi:hypothetical protein